MCPASWRGTSIRRGSTLVVGDLDVVRTDLDALGLGAPVVLPADAF